MAASTSCSLAGPDWSQSRQMSTDLATSSPALMQRRAPPPRSSLVTAPAGTAVAGARFIILFSPVVESLSECCCIHCDGFPYMIGYFGQALTASPPSPTGSTASRFIEMQTAALSSVAESTTTLGSTLSPSASSRATAYIQVWTASLVLSYRPTRTTPQSCRRCTSCWIFCIGLERAR